MHQEQSAIDAWYHHWVIEGFEAYRDAGDTGRPILAARR